MSTKRVSSGAPVPRREIVNGGRLRAKPESEPPQQSGRAERADDPLCVVAIGAAAGGVEALSALLHRLPEDTGMAFVVVLHLPAERPPALVELLARTTRLPVVEASPGMRLLPNRVHVIPPSAVMTIADGCLARDDRPQAPPHMPVDAFLRSLALDQQSRAIGVILSGSGSDGSLGTEAVKGAGGITLAQDARSAKFDAMPLSAISTGCVDYMLPPEGIAAQLGELAAGLRGAVFEAAAAAADDVSDEELGRVCGVLRAAHDVDFTLYRHSTIRRRIQRRKLLARARTTAEYIEMLEGRPLEVESLYQDILIKVTQFFRDPEAFAAMQRSAFPAILRARQEDGPIRIWVPGCSTGEEVYSVAIAFIEVAAEMRHDVPFQLFATDVSEEALAKARAGIYLENIAADVSPERLGRFFTRAGKHYQINKSIRDACVFAQQNVTRDPPFSKLDLISCRNVLIYFEPALQKRIVPTFHYALRPSGYLVLGASETVSGLSEHFTLVDKKNKIYAKNAAPTRPSLDLGRRQQSTTTASAELALARPGPSPARPFDLQAEADRLVMTRYAPPGVVVNAELQIVQFRGHTGPYIEPAPGEASLNVLKMARDGLVLELRGALHKARRTGAPVRVERVPLRADGARREIAIEVIPFSSSGSVADEGSGNHRWFLILFEELAVAPEKGRGAAKGKAKEDSHAARLERELSAAKEYLQLTIEEHEATNEELQSANEELLSSNEELQSINEELETAKEELESTNEELLTLNEELENRNVDLSRLNNDLMNLLASVNIPIVMLSIDHRIRRFTPLAERVLNLIPSDIGRPIGDIKPKIEVPDLEPLIAEVIDTVSIREREVQDRDGRWYLMRVRPYRTMDNKIDGAVIVLVDVDRLKRSASMGGTTMEH
ncbi:MAG: CheR family methyltransferase [Minicystis sp.]